MPWVVIASDLHLIHFQHHTETWLTSASEERLPPEVSHKRDNRSYNPSTRFSQVIVHRLSLNEVKTLAFYAFAHLFKTYLPNTYCVPAQHRG